MWKKIYIFVLILFIFYTSTFGNVVENTDTNDSEDLKNETDIPTKTTPRELSLFENDTKTSVQEETIIPSKEGIHFFVPYNEVIKADTTEETNTGDTETTIETTRAWIPEFSPKSRKSGAVNDTPVKIKEIVKKCPKYKHIEGNFNLYDMVKTWQIIYSNAPDKEAVQCFKIQIKEVTQEAKDEFKVNYGNFSGKIDWDKCNLEILSSMKMEWRHFLHGDNENGGVLDNVIVMHEHPEDTPEDNQPYFLKDEDPDQWKIYKNLLLMRDCETDIILIFSSVPAERARHDLEEAWKKFGVQFKDVKMSCINYQLNSTAVEEETSSEAGGDLVERLSDDGF